MCPSIIEATDTIRIWQTHDPTLGHLNIYVENLPVAKSKPQYSKYSNKNRQKDAIM